MSLGRIRAIFFRYFYILFRGTHSWADLFYWPFVDILLWGLTSVWLQARHSAPDLPLLFMTGLIFWQIVWRGSIDISLQLLQEFWNRNLVNLFSTPLKIYEWSMGVIFLSLCKLLLTLSFGSFLAYVLYSLNIFALGWISLFFIIVLVLFGWVLGFLAASAIIYWGNQVGTLAWMIAFVFAPFSAVFYPVSALPKWAQTVSWCLPTTYIFEAIRSILSTNNFPFYYVWVSLTFDIIYLILSLALLQFMFKKSQAKGLARLE